MNYTDALGLFTIATLLLAAIAGVGLSRLPRPIKLLLQIGLALRLVGALARYGMIFYLYGGVGDAIEYYHRGLEYAERFHRLDFSPFWDPTLWRSSTWWGTQFMSWPSGIVLSLLGPTMLGAFVAFSLLSFLGLLGFAAAFRRSYPHVSPTRYLFWIWLFPSLWFWPSSIGKEAITLMGMGLAVAGFVGKDERPNWPLTVLGLFFVYAIRPQVAAVLVLSFVLSQWLASGIRWTPAKVAQGLAVLVLGLVAISYSLSSVGVSDFDADGVQRYMADDAARRIDYGSSVEAVDVGIGGIPFALVNVLFRPFPFEATNAMVLVSSLEIWIFWALVWMRRRKLAVSLRHWRSDRFLRVAFPFILTYSIALGMMLTNLGIIARQRIFLFPFLFLLLEAAPRALVPRSKGNPLPARDPRAVPAYSASPSA